MKINEFKQTEQLKLIEAKFVRGRKLLDSMCEGLDAEQRRIVEGVYASAIPLMKETVVAEAAMTADQIAQLFGNAEKAATASGSNRTALGKGKDVTDAAGKMLKDAALWLQDTAPVQAFDNKFEQGKQALKAKLGNSAAGQKVLQSVEALGDYAKENPGKTAFAIGILTAVASIAGGPLGGAIAGQVLRGSMELVKGEKLSTAIGKGLKAAAMGFLAGKAFEAIGDIFGDFVEDVQYGDLGEFSEKGTLVYSHYGSADVGGGNVYRDWVFDTNKLSGILTPDQQTEITDYFNTIQKVASDSIGDSTVSSKQAMEDIRGIISKLGELTKSYTEENIANNPGIEEYLENGTTGLLDSIEQWTDVTSASVQGAVTGAVSKDKESGTGPGSPATKGDEAAIEKAAEENDVEGVAVKSNTESVEMSEAQVRQLFVGASYITESRLDELDFGAIKAKAGQIAKAGMAKAQEVGKNMTTRVTTNKLNKAWEKAGKPTDSADIMKILQDNGVEAEVATQAFKDTGVEAPPPVEKPNVDANKLADFVNSLPEKEKEEIKKLVIARQQELATA